MFQYESPNYLDGRFRNQIPTAHFRYTALGNKLLEYLCNGRQRRPSSPLPVKKLDKADLASDRPGLRITWLGHSTSLVEIDGHVLLIDPVFSPRVSPVAGIGPKRFYSQLPLEPAELPPVDGVLISHDHYDHLDKASIKAIHSRVKQFFVPLGVGRLLARWGVAEQKITELDWWQRAVCEPELTVVATPARHYSGRGLKFNLTLWSSWVVIGPRHRVFFSGDGGYSPTFREIGDRYGPFGVTLMEAGQYNKIWPQIHMLPEQSVQAHRDVGGEVMLPVHWSAFCLSVHRWTEPVERVLTTAAECQVQIATPRVGEQLDYGRGIIPADTWWAH